MLLALRDEGIGIESVTVAKPSLDEVFLALTGHDAHEHDETDPTAQSLDLEAVR